MAHKRKNFTDNQRANIYARDSAICGFSGQSLWLFDYGLRPNWDMDWADHIKPSAQGGGADINNGICASSFFNSKKKDNSHDNVYFFKDGAVTDFYIRAYGIPSKDIMERLSRLKKLTPTDWYINRAISSVFIALDWRCHKEFFGQVKKRDDNYWFSSGWTKLQKYIKNKSSQCLVSRGLILSPLPLGTDMLLEFQFINSHNDYLNLCEKIYPVYRENFYFWDQFIKADLSGKETIIDTAIENESIHPELLLAVQRQFISLNLK